jgi:hypothetical protein
MEESHRSRVETLLADAAAEHEVLMTKLPEDLRDSLPVDAQGVTQAIDYLAIAAGMSPAERQALIRPHAVNPAVLHETVIGSFVEGARVRADALAVLADTIGGEPLGREIRTLLVANPPPVRADGNDVVPALRATYAAHERAAIAIAASLDGA